MITIYRLKGGFHVIEESLHAIQQRMADAMARVGYLLSLDKPQDDVFEFVK